MHCSNLERNPLRRSGTILLLLVCSCLPSLAIGNEPSKFLEAFCQNCHNAREKRGELLLPQEVAAHAIESEPDLWEKVVRKLKARQMPPLGDERPSEKDYSNMIAYLESVLDMKAIRQPKPGRTDTFRRLSRTEYQNAIRDLLAIEIDAPSLLPPDELSHGFDNITVGDLSPTLLGRYISAAEKISRIAVGLNDGTLEGDTIRIKPDVTQEGHVEGLPIGTRGGAVIPYNFPRDGVYEVQMKLTRDRNEIVEGLSESHEMVVLVDRKRVATLTIKPPPGRVDYSSVDSHLKTRVEVSAGPHELGVTFIQKGSPLLETKRQPFNAHFNMHRHPRKTPALYQVSVIGPYSQALSNASSPSHVETPSRLRIFIAYPTKSDEESSCANKILNHLLRRAYRREVSEEDLKKPLEFFEQGRANGGFEHGIELALASILVNPHFLFRMEQEPEGLTSSEAYSISEVELASRLSFFLWSSIPDESLLDLAQEGKLRDPEKFEDQVRRMLRDPRSQSLVTNFAEQWLYLRNLESFTPDLRLYPDFDDNLRQAFRKETELFVASILDEEKSVLDLIRSNYTFLNERLAKHYGIPNVYGSRFRRVLLDENQIRGGLLRHGSILTVTSYATRTSPVIRGHWILKNLLGAPPPPPPANVPALTDNTVSSSLPIRERLAAHRANPACAGCHDLMDPVGFALENFDAVGRWRETEAGKRIDVSGSLPGTDPFEGVRGLEMALLQQPELIAGTITEKLLTFALGRGIELSDAPAVRKIVRKAAADNYRFSSILVGVCESDPFQMRTKK